MRNLPDALQQYFSSGVDGLELLLPEFRKRNKRLLRWVNEALLKEESYTERDVCHLETLILIADNVQIPFFNDEKSLIEAEHYLIKSCPTLSYRRLRYCLDYLFHLLIRHGHLQVDKTNSRTWIKIWRHVMGYKPLEQPLMVGYVRWLQQKNFSPRTIYDCLWDLPKFKVYLELRGVYEMGDITEDILFDYLESRSGCTQRTSKEAALNRIKPFLHYYKVTVFSTLKIPTGGFSGSGPQGTGPGANSLEIKTLWEAVETGKVSDQAALMLVFIMGYGLPIRALPLLQITGCHGELVYLRQLPNRIGVKEEKIQIPTSELWLTLILENLAEARPKGYPYLFINSHAIKRVKPVSVIYCQRQIQSAVKSILGYPLTANYLQRGAINTMAMSKSLSEFLKESGDVPLSSHSRMITWFNYGPAKQI